MNAVAQCTGHLVVLPDPVTTEGRTSTPLDVRPGESLKALLERHVDLSEPWEVSIGGHVVPESMWQRVRPKPDQVIEVRAAVGRQAVALVAMAALTYFTFGIGTAATGSLFIGSGATIGGGYLAAASAYVAGAVIERHVIE